MNIDSITNNVIEILTETVDEIIALSLVGGYILGKFTGVDIPEEVIGIVLVYYYVKNK